MSGHRLDAAIAELENDVRQFLRQRHCIWLRVGGDELAWYDLGFGRSWAVRVRSYIAALRVLRRERDEGDRLGWVPPERTGHEHCFTGDDPAAWTWSQEMEWSFCFFTLGARFIDVEHGAWVPDSRDDQVWRCFGVRTSETWGQHEQTWWARRMRDAHILLRDHETAEVE